MVKISGHDFYVHRLVAFAFLGPPPTKQAWQVHHGDGNRSNNSVENLEYVTASQNVRHSFASFSRRCGAAKRSKPVMWRAVGSQSWTTSLSMKQAASELGISGSSVSLGAREGKAVKGYEFQFADRSEADVLEGEEWRQMYDPLSGVSVPGRMVSSLGRIMSKNGQISWGTLALDGYFRTTVALSKGEYRTGSVHRLVAFAFLGPPVSTQRSQVNHKDMDKGNNAVENLEYVTASENMKHCYANSTNTNRSRIHCGPVESRLLTSIEGWAWHPAVNSAAKALGVHTRRIAACINGHKTDTCGYEFRLAADDIYPGEEWRVVDLPALLREKAKRCSV